MSSSPTFSTLAEDGLTGASRSYERAKLKYGPRGAITFASAICLAFLVVIWAVILCVSSIVFAVQALVVGSQALDNSKDGPCQTMAQWMVTFGSFVLVGCFLSICCESRSREDEHKVLTIFGFLTRFFHLLTFCWVCYGFSLLTRHNYSSCSASQFNVFALMTLYMFWGTMAILIAVGLILCAFFPMRSIFAQIDGFSALKQDDDIINEDDEGIDRLESQPEDKDPFDKDPFGDDNES